MNTFLAIDPGTNGLGVALFRQGRLVKAATLQTTEKVRLERCRDLWLSVSSICARHGIEFFVCEDPVMRGKAGATMQRFLGGLEYMLFSFDIHYIHPMTVKKEMGSGSLDKVKVARAAVKKLKTKKEKDVVRKLIKEKKFDATDAVAIGLTYLIKEGGK